MSDFAERILRLTPEKRDLLLERLRRAAGSASGEPSIPRRANPERAPLSFAQLRLWFLDQLSRERGGYQIVGALRLEGDLNTAALQQSLVAILQRHEVLRTTIHVADGEPYQCISPVADCPLAAVDLTHLDVAAQQGHIRQFLDEEQHRGFDLVRGPLLRATLFTHHAQDHTLVIALHHIVADGWSSGILRRELSECYGAFCRGATPRLPELPIQYGDFAEWQRSWMQGDVLVRQLRYWREQLSGAPLLQLPVDHRRPAVPSGRGGIQQRWLEGPLRDSLVEFCRRQAVTLYMTLLACFQLLLARYSGQSDIVVGTPVANRNRSEIEGLIGFFVNTLVMRTDLSGNLPFLRVLERVRDTVISAFANQDLPFERLVEELHPHRDDRRNPLFQVAFAVQNAPREKLEMPGLLLTPVIPEVTTTRFELELHVWEQPRGLQLTATFDRDLYEASTVAGILNQLEVVIRHVVANPYLPIGNIPLLSADECTQTIAKACAEPRQYPRETGLIELFRKQVDRAPQAIAVVDGERKLTYDELDRKSDQIAGRLRAQGIQQEAAVAIALEPSCESIAATLAVLKADGAYVPLDLAAPPARSHRVLHESGAKLVLTVRSRKDKLAGWCPVPLWLCDEEPVSHSSTRLVTRARGDNLAYLMYTSGSTGQPKGIAVTQRAVVRLVVNTNYVQLGAEDIVAHASNPAFDAATFEIWGALLHGGCVAITPKESLLSSHALRQHLERHGITVLFLTTSLYHHLAEEDPRVFASLRYLLFGGEAVLASAVHAVARTGKPWHLINGYGPTEGTTFSTFHVVDGERAPDDIIPIGRPISQTEVYVLDERLQLVPRGVPGQLYLGGDGLARGYVANSRLTAEKFVPHPFSLQPGQRLYATGDVARWNWQGNLEFLGRHDHQVKMRGFRIELGEIEALLRRHPDVYDAAVLLQSDQQAEQRIVAYFTARDRRRIGEGPLLQSLRANLPDYMVPSILVQLEQFPLNASGKIDRAALAAVVPESTRLSRADGGDGQDVPRTPVEMAVSEIFAELLQRTPVPLRESFFDLGGHSLLATQLASRLRNVFEIDLPLNVLFRAASVEALSAEIDRRLRVGQPDNRLPILPYPRAEHSSASFAQQRLWFLQRFQPGQGLWHVPWLVELRGPLQREALQRSLDAIVARHESLRTCFAEVAGQPVQIIAPQAICPILYRDLRGMPAVDRERCVQQLAANEQRDAFELNEAPLMRSQLLQLEDERFVLSLTLHHIVCDGWSLGVLSRELALGYNALTRGHPLPLSPLPIQYADFAEWQRRRLKERLLSSQLDYWRQQLADLSTLQLPTDRGRTGAVDDTGATVVRQLSASLTRAIRILNRQQGTTLYMTLLAAFNVLLARYTGQTDVVVGTPIANRNFSELEGLIGLFVNSLVLRTDLTGDPTFRELLQRVRSTAVSAFAHQDIPFERLVEELKPERHPHRHPLFQVVFAVQNAPSPPLQLDGVSVRPIRFDVATTRYDMQLDIWEQPDALQLHAFYRCHLFERSTMERWLEHFENLLTRIVEDPGRRLSEYVFLSDDERTWLAARQTTVGPVARTDSAESCLPTRFAERAAETPDAIAVRSVESSLTYRELDRWSNRIAHTLRQHDVRAEIPVGLFVERSASLVAGMLGILKAGGAFVPLEPTWPDHRIAHLLQITDAPVVVTQASLQERWAAMARADAKTRGPAVVVVDTDEMDSRPADALPFVATPENLAYIMFTSGSAGPPKGVLITHANVVRLFDAVEGQLSFGASDVWTLFHSYAFDFSVWEIWGALLFGGTLSIVPYHVSRTPDEFRGWLSHHRVTVLNQTPGAFRQLAEVAAPSEFPYLRYVIFGGEALDPAILGAWHKSTSGPARLVNMYGITETTVHVTFGPLEPNVAGTSSSSPIGVPLGDLRIFLLDRWGQQVPRGCPGEICVGGPGLARGYLGDPARTAKKFIPDAFSGMAGQRLYRSGDLARYRPDGSLEFLGRRDGQVKVRGFRVELGEVESMLRTCDRVRDAIVIEREDEPGDKRLVGYVIPHFQQTRMQHEIAAEKHRLVRHWQQLYDDLYRSSGPAPDAQFNLAGWISSYTDEPIPADAMWEQVEQAVERILAHAPQRILEIGCGTGLLLHRLAPRCNEYLGTDLSAVALEGLRRDGLPDNATLELREADDLSHVPPRSVDAVVLNSVVQYFPELDYLERVITQAWEKLRPGGIVFVGDVRSQSLWGSFQASVELFRSDELTPIAELRERVRQQMEQERELLIHPGWFDELSLRLPGVTEVRVEPKRGRLHHEMTQFRYDVRLQWRGGGAAPHIPEWHSWHQQPWSIGEISQRLRRGSGPSWGLLGVDNVRVREAVCAAELLAELPDQVTAGEARELQQQRVMVRPAIDPEMLWALEDEVPWRVWIRWTGERPNGEFDVAFVPLGAAGDASWPAFPAPTRPQEPSGANSPWRPQFATRLAQELRSELQQRLPDYMIPAALVLLDRFPLTSRGKLDRRKLPAPDLSRLVMDERFAAPRSELESSLARIWCEVLRVRQVGIHDNFFDLGGHSLLATQVVARVRDSCRLELPLRVLFESPTVAELAAKITALQEQACRTTGNEFVS